MGCCMLGATIPKAQILLHVAVHKTSFNLVFLKTSGSRCAQVSRQPRLPESCIPALQLLNQ